MDAERMGATKPFYRAADGAEGPWEFLRRRAAATPTTRTEGDMSETDDGTVRPLLAGTVLLQQIILELLIRQNAIGYPQAREFLTAAAADFDRARDVPPESLKPLLATIDMLDDLHRPRELGEQPRTLNWVDQLRRNGLL